MYDIFLFVHIVVGIYLHEVVVTPQITNKL